MTSFIHCENLVKIYKIADLEVVALQGLDLEVEKGEMMALVGASGSGKSTLLNILGGLDSPSAGIVSVSNGDLLNLTERQRVNYKRKHVGFVWQQPSRNLLPYLSALENVETPMMLNNQSAKQRYHPEVKARQDFLTPERIALFRLTTLASLRICNCNNLPSLSTPE